METIRLRVTAKVIEQARQSIGQQQIAMSRASPSIAAIIARATKSQQIQLLFCDAFRLSIGDTGAIWRSHNLEALESFDRLYKMLSATPDIEHEFVVATAKSIASS